MMGAETTVVFVSCEAESTASDCPDLMMLIPEAGRLSAPEIIHHPSSIIHHKSPIAS
jgi:hypothetical protein